MKPFYKSKKLWATLIGITIGPVCRHFDIQITPEELSQAQNLIMIYVVGQGVADNGIYNTKDVTEPTSKILGTQQEK
jgi:uncharacterized membrane protein YbjE (DUF340 family)